MNLYNIDGEMKLLEEMMEDCINMEDGTIKDEKELELVEEMMRELNDEGESKIKSYIHVIRNSEGNITSLDEEIKRLQALKKSEKSKINKLKSVLDAFFKNNNITKMDLGIAKISYRKSTVVEDTFLENVPSHMILEKVEHKLDKKAFKSFCKEQGIEGFEGCKLVQKLNMQIK